MGTADLYARLRAFDEQYIPFPPFVAAKNAIETNLQMFRETGVATHMLVTGEAGTGKSSLCRWLALQHPRRVLPERDLVEVLITSVPPAASISSVASAMLTALGDTAGNVAINKVPVTTNQACCNFVVDPCKADYRFLYYYLKGNYSNLVGLKLGGSQQNLNAATLKRFPVPVVSLDVQRKVVAILSAYDDLIANNQRRIALLESMAEEIYREWFVRMRFPGTNTLRAQALSPFDHLCVLSRGFDLPDDDMQPGDVPVIASTSIKGYHNVAKVKPPVVTTGRSGSLGTVLLVNEPAWPLNTALYVKDFKGNSPYLVFFTLKNLHLENFNAGAGVPTLNRNHLAGIRVHVPSLGVQQAFDRRIGPMLQLSETLRKSNAGLTAQRDALLPRLISGKLRVDQLNIQTPPSMRAETAQAV